ncbi:unnamed protein product, partial [Thlaspi arvense]
ASIASFHSLGNSRECLTPGGVLRFQCIRDMGILSPRRIGCNPGGHQTQVSRSARVLRHSRKNARENTQSTK